jgi:hypothetical protein
MRYFSSNCLIQVQDSNDNNIKQAIFEFGPDYVISVILRSDSNEYEICVFHESKETPMIGITDINGIRYGLSEDDIECIFIKMVNITGFNPVQV